MSCQSSLHLDSRRHHGLLLCAGGRLLSRDHDVPVLDASTVGDSEQGMEDKGLTSERAFGARVREATLGDDLSNAVVRQGDSLLGEGGECRNQTNHAVGEARVVLHVRFPARWSSSAEVSPSTRMLCTAPWAILRVSAVSALWSIAESRRSVCGRWPSRGPMVLRLPSAGQIFGSQYATGRTGPPSGRRHRLSVRG